MIKRTPYELSIIVRDLHFAAVASLIIYANVCVLLTAIGGLILFAISINPLISPLAIVLIGG
jgi:hypothetical protein